MNDVDYEALVAAFPPEDTFAELTGAYKKLSLSERYNADIYKTTIKTSPYWSAFHAYIKSKAFVEQVFGTLMRNQLTIYGGYDGQYKSRFEFSALPADGGMIFPHRDISSKVVTLVVPVVREPEWKQKWGGGTDFLRPLTNAVCEDYKTPKSDFASFLTLPFFPQQAAIFIKTDNSWHSVGPIAGPAGRFRRTLTINIERA
jgi:hypothetical protein